MARWLAWFKRGVLKTSNTQTSNPLSFKPEPINFQTSNPLTRNLQNAQTMRNMPNPLWEEQEDILVDEDIGSDHPVYLIVYNDDVNSFDWVIQCFMEILKHSHEQAEQLSIIIHFKGKATVKTGPKDELRPLCEALLDRGLSAVIED